MSKSFELVLTDLDNRLDPFLRERPTTLEGIKEKVMLVYLRVNIQSMIPLYFNSLRSHSAEAYASFSDVVLRPGDAVITFNYDLALDREMKTAGKWSIGNGYGFELNAGFFGASPCKLYKLHGSTNWRGEHFKGQGGFFQLGHGEMSLGQRPIIDPSEFMYLGYSSGSDPQWHDGRTRAESLVMPTANKRFYIETSLGREWESFWDSLWHQAGNDLKRSEEIYLIGYSIPEFDTRARSLLGSNVPANALVKVCCHSGTAGVVQSLRHMSQFTAMNVQPASSTTFEGWISSMIRN